MTQPLSRRPKALNDIDQRIYFIRGQRVMLDSDLAELYGSTTFNLNKAVKRNQNRFPGDFMFQFSQQEWTSLIFQNGISNCTLRGGRRFKPYVFTEQGVAMLSGVLNSKRAVQVNLAIMRAFVRLRELIATNKELTRKLSELERRLEGHDEEIGELFDAIRRLMNPPVKGRPPLIGFKPAKEQ